jgi:hypothetical protein
VGQERLGPSYFFISLVLGPLNSLVWYVPSLRYTRSLGWRMHCGVKVTESSTSKQHHQSRGPKFTVGAGEDHVELVTQGVGGAVGAETELEGNAPSSSDPILSIRILKKII